jgi:hypothetical protein
MWETVLGWATVVLVVVAVLRFVAVRLGLWGCPKEPEELNGVPARLRSGPRPRSGAVALEEPDDDEESE